MEKGGHAGTREGNEAPGIGSANATGAEISPATEIEIEVAIEIGAGTGTEKERTDPTVTEIETEIGGEEPGPGPKRREISGLLTTPSLGSSPGLDLLLVALAGCHSCAWLVWLGLRFPFFSVPDEG